MYDDKPQNKFFALISIFLSEYLVWLIFAGIVLFWFFYRDIVENLGNLILFWAPTLILTCSFILVLIKIFFKTKADEDQGIMQYDITVTKGDFYLVEMLIYFGTLSILVTSFFAKEKGVEVIDLIHALLFFIFANWLKQIFYKKIQK
ncbi:MAG: hypothetical protein NTX00_05020 [Candidatus Parcubacteria bacterium]|nr:hypothetical protein [Candidatus Parcubacteria bacterium]